MSLRKTTSLAIGIAIVQSGITIFPDPPLQWWMQLLWSVLFVVLSRVAWHRMTRATQHRTIQTLRRIPQAVSDMLEQSEQ